MLFCNPPARGIILDLVCRIMYNLGRLSGVLLYLVPRQIVYFCFIRVVYFVLLSLSPVLFGHLLLIEGGLRRYFVYETTQRPTSSLDYSLG